MQNLITEPVKGKRRERVLDGEIMGAAPIASDLLNRVRAGLTAGYSLAGAAGSRRTQLQILDAFNALRGLSR